jgi:predicted ester cyclase
MVRSLRLVLLIAFAVVLAVPRSYTSATEQATPAADCLVTTPEENKALVLRYWDEVWKVGGQDAIDELLAPDEVHHWGIGDDTTDTKAYGKRLGLFLTAFPDIHFAIDVIAAEGDHVATRYTATATQTGEWQGVAPTGNQVRWSGTNIFRFACGQIAESWGEADHVSLLQQIGAPNVPAPMAPPAAEIVAATPGTFCTEDTPDKNLAIVRRWTEDVIDQGNLDVLDEIADPNIVHHPGAFPDVQGVDAVKQVVGNLRTVFPDINDTIDEAFVDGDIVVVRWSGTGTQDGPFLGMEPTGTPVMMTGINVYRLSCDRIVEIWSEANVLDELRQIQRNEAATPAAAG